MASTNFTSFFMADSRASDVSVPREWTRPKVSASLAATIVWAQR